MSYKWHHNFPKIAREAGFVIRELSIGHCIDWRFVASIDPYNIVSELDYEKLDEFIPHISEVPIGTVLNNRILDPAIGKYFILAQFSIQYLLFCKQFLDETVVEIRNTLQALHGENARLEKMNKKRNEETMLLQKKLQRVENISNHQPQQAMVFPCTKCTKNFISAELLQAHMVRKHANLRLQESSERKPSTTDTNLINTIKLELEVKQLKERLNATEKDLHDQRFKYRRCHTCSESVSSAHDELHSKIRHSVGIQSNLTDDKDSNEKEVQTQPVEPLSAIRTDAIVSPPPIEPRQQEPSLSKSDLQSFIEEQKQLFEQWKDAERLKFNEELEAVKRNLIDAVHTMQTAEKAVPVQFCDDTVWKERYQELETMFQNSQQQTRDTMTIFERGYTQKMEHLESLLTRMLHDHDGKDSPLESSEAGVVKPAHHKPQIQLRTVTLPEIIIEGDPGHQDHATTPAAVSAKTSSQKEISSSESDSTQESVEEEIRTTEASRVRSVAPSPADVPAQVKAKQTSPKKQILNQFRARLKMIGIDAKSKQLSGEDLNDACEALAFRRDTMKKKHKHFFITRNQLLSKVDQIAQGFLSNGPHGATLHKAHVLEDKPILSSLDKLTSTSKAPASVTRLRPSPALELLPSKHTIHAPGKNANQTADIFKTKSATVAGGSMVVASRPIIKLTGDDMITVHAEVQPAASNRASYVPARNQNVTHKPSFSKYDQQIEKLLETPIKTINPSAQQEQPVLAAEDRNSDISEMLDAVPAHPKPIPKKRVLFNLEKTGPTGSVPEPPATTERRSVARLDLKLEEESDWNISSFDEDK